MKQLKLAPSLGAALLALIASAAWSQSPPQPAMGAAPATTLPATPGAPQPPASRWTAAQVREAFELADSDSSGALTRAEAQQLRILPRSFEDMDQNKNGLLERAEYEAVFFR